MCPRMVNPLLEADESTLYWERLGRDSAGWGGGGGIVIIPSVSGAGLGHVGQDVSCRGHIVQEKHRPTKNVRGHLCRVHSHGIRKITTSPAPLLFCRPT
jgi:hypothetical protein